VNFRKALSMSAEYEKARSWIEKVEREQSFRNAAESNISAIGEFVVEPPPVAIVEVSAGDDSRSSSSSSEEDEVGNNAQR